MELQDVEFAAIILKDKEGAVKVMPFPEKEGIPAPPSLNDVYDACHTIVRNIDNQQTAQAVHMAMMSAMQQAQEHQNKTKSGLVVP